MLAQAPAFVNIFRYRIYSAAARPLPLPRRQKNTGEEVHLRRLYHHTLSLNCSLYVTHISHGFYDAAEAGDVGAGYKVSGHIVV